MNTRLAAASGALLIGVLCAPGLASAANVDVNGACIAGNPCPSGTALPYGGSNKLPFSDTFSVNGDPFKITGDLATSSPSGLSFAMNFLVTYTGSTPLAHADDVTVAGTELFDEPFGSVCCTWNTGLYGYFGSGVGSGSNVTFTNTINGTAFDLGPFDAPTPFTESTTFFAQNTSPLPDTFSYTLDFAEGTAGGAAIAIDQAVPEPATWAMMLLGVLAIGGLLRAKPRCAAA